MTIYKDKKYFGIYLTCVICATILSAFVCWFLLFLSNKGLLKWYIFLMPVFAILGDIFAYNSFIGYVKTPQIILEIKDDEVLFTPDRKKNMVAVKITDIKGVDIIRPLICRSGKRIIINTSNAKYRLEDIDDANKAYDILVEKLKG